MEQPTLDFTLDQYQKDVLATKGNIALRSGRQVGKSTIISIKAGEYAIKNPNQTVMVIAAVERQSQLLFEKILDYIYRNYKKFICKGKKRPTKSKLQLTNGSVIHCLPTGDSGFGIRGYTIDLLIADEAAFIPEDVWTAVTPMLAMTGGDTWLLSTPFGKSGYYYDCFQDEDYTTFHVKTPEVLEFSNRTERQKSDLKKKLISEQKRMTKIQFAQEYLGEFVDKLRQFFPDDLVKSVKRIERPKELKGKLYLGVDIARYGKDETTFEIVEVRGDKVIHLEHLVYKNIKTTDISRMIAHAHRNFKFKKIYIDSTGIGAGVLDQLMENPITKRKVVGIENASKKIDGDRKKRVAKEELYDNLSKLMERGKIQLLDDPEINTSLKSILYEYSDAGKIKIYGKYSHIVEGLIRACWGIKDKSLKIYLR